MQITHGGHDLTLLIVGIAIIVVGVLCEAFITAHRGLRVVIYIGILVVVVWFILLLLSYV